MLDYFKLAALPAQPRQIKFADIRANTMDLYKNLHYVSGRSNENVTYIYIYIYIYIWP